MLKQAPGKAFACAMLLLLACGPAANAQTNVVLIMADDVGFECFSSYGSREYSTPRLDELGAKGIRFTNCHSTPLCTPSRVNLMSGKSNVFNYKDFGVYPKGEPTFGNHFKQHGYATVVAGKWQLKTNDAGTTPKEAGFDEFCLWNYPGFGRARYWDPSFNCNGELLELPKGTYGPEVMTDFIIDFIRANKDKPFLAYYPMILVHNPFPPTPDSDSRDETDNKKNFIDMVGYMDTCVGRIVDTLEELDLRDNTLVVFTGDNGTNSVLASEFQGKTIQGGKGYTHDYGTHVPLYANWPDHIPANQVNDDLICFSDFFATITEAAGLPPKEIADGDGWSFWPQCLGKEGRKREAVYGYYFPRPYSDKFDDKYKHYEVRYARDKRFKLYDNGKLFDTIDDVLEEKPVDSKTGSAAEQARKKLQNVLNAFPDRGRAVDYSRVNGN